MQRESKPRKPYTKPYLSLAKKRSGEPKRYFGYWFVDGRKRCRLLGPESIGREEAFRCLDELIATDGRRVHTCLNPECGREFQASNARHNCCSIECGQRLIRLGISPNSKPRGPIHRISNVDESARTGTCSECGDVAVFLHTGYWRCRRRHSVMRRRHRLGVVISYAEVNAMYQAQDKSCAICKKAIHIETDAAWGSKAHLDHCHKTGRVRALLCSACNMGIGQFHDDIELLKKAQLYLMRFEDETSAAHYNAKAHEATAERVAA